MNSKIYVPPASGLKFVPVNYHANCGNLPQNLSPFVRNTDNTLLRDEILSNKNQNINYNIGIKYYREAAYPYLSCTPLIIQLKSDFPTTAGHNIKVYQNCDLDTALDTVAMTLKTNNQEYAVYYDCRLASDGAGGMYVYFETGQIYKTVPYPIDNFYLNGSLPEFADEITEVSVINSLGNTGTYTVLETVYVEELNAFAFRVDHAFSGSDTVARVLMTYKRDEFNSYQSELDLSDYDGMNIRLKIEAINPLVGESGITRTIWSEPIMVRDKLPGIVKFEWSHSEDKFFVDFSDSVKFAAFLPLRLFEIEIDAIEDEQLTTDTGRIIPINSVFSERYTLVGWMLPRWMVKLVDLILKLDTVYINGEQYQKIGAIAAEKETERSDRFNVEATMNKINANGVYDTNYDFDHQTPIDEAAYLLIDEDDNLKIDSNSKLKI